MSESGAEMKNDIQDNLQTNVEQNLTNTTDNNSTMNDSQTFNLVDFDETQLTETKTNEEEISKSLDVIEGTPEKESSSPLKRPYFGMIGNKKCDVEDSDDEPAAKLFKLSSEIIPETQQSQDNDDELITKDNKNDINNEKIIDHKLDDMEKLLSSNKVDNDSFEALSQALESVLDDDNKTKNDNNDKNIEDELKLIGEGETNDNKMEIDDDKKIQDQQQQQQQEQKINDDNNDNIINNDNDLTNLSNNLTDDNNSVKKSRISIEVVYDKALEPASKPKELVELDDDGEKIILDSSNDDSITSLKTNDNKTLTTSSNKMTETTESKMTNGGNSDLNNDSDRTASLPSDSSVSTITGILDKQKIPEILNLISDSEGESFISDDKSKIKTFPIEKEINLLMKVKCLLQIDDNSKELIGKEILGVYCDNLHDLQLSRRRNSDTSNMADISDNKDPTSPASIISNPQQFPLIPSRLSLMSLASSSSSSSSGSSKFPIKDNPFSLPRGVPKHAKKLNDNIIDDLSDRLKKEWKNINLISTSVINFINNELINNDIHNGINEQSDNNILDRFRSSTPENLNSKDNQIIEKSNKKNKLNKRSRNQNNRSSKSNGVNNKTSSLIDDISNNQDIKDKKDEQNKIITSPLTPNRPSGRSLGILRSHTPIYDPSDALVGKKCFAKWSDNNYYPGTVINKIKGKFKINFLDGKNKLLIEDFIIPTPPTLPNNLSIYATTKNDDYGSCGMITGVENKSDDGNDTRYVVETDEGEKLKVFIKDIFLTSDQALILKETINETVKNLTTPRSEKISLDNIIEGSRRNKSISVLSTPKSSKNKSRIDKLTDEPSGSGLIQKSFNYDESSESDFKQEDGENDLGGIQPEIIGTSNASSSKGPQNRVKGKGKSKKKIDDSETINLLGPIPEDSNLFKGMSFILTCAPLESLDKYKSEIQFDSNSELGTDYEEEWTRKPFIRDRLMSQLIAGGGKIYNTFEEIPKDDYKNVKLITNVPNVTAKSLLCLSAGIIPYNHQWIIRCCQENKLLNLSSESLPAGWSLEKKSYLEMNKRPSNLPFQNIKVVIPKITSTSDKSLSFWQQVIENAGGIVQFIKDQSDDFIDGVAVLTNHKCPSWVLQKAEMWNIPLVSSTWIIQCLIEGQPVPYYSQPAYSYNHFN